MKLYKNVMVPADEKETSPHFIAGGMWECKTGLICMSIEEALEMWNAGRHRQSDELGAENLSKVTAPDFHNYMKSNNINI